MTRTSAREIVVRLCFSISATNESAEALLEHTFDEDYYKSLAKEDELFSEYPDEKQLDYIKRMVSGISTHSIELDDYIEKYSKGWQFSRISRTALAIMKTAMFEVLYMPDVPNGVSINEAVELAKKYDGTDTASFVNGILGSFAKNETV